MRLQLGGGIRSEADVAAAVEAGAWRVIVGTLASDDPEAAGRIARETGRLVAAVDCRDGSVRVRGWAADSGADPLELVARLVGVRRPRLCGHRPSTATARAPGWMLR